MAASLNAADLSKNFYSLKNKYPIKVELRYASQNNFMNQNLYGDFKTCYLHPLAAEKFEKAQNILKNK
jgi:D-alanyl-D-alanine dipeptidase